MVVTIIVLGALALALIATLRTATSQELAQMEGRIMSVISDAMGRIKAHMDRQDTAIDGVVVDVAELKRIIEELQNSPGTVTPEDQALLNELETRIEATATKVEALDAATPPPLPPVIP